MLLHEPGMVHSFLSDYPHGSGWMVTSGDPSPDLQAAGAHTHKIKGPRAQPDATGNSLVVEAEVLEAFLEEAEFEPQMLWN